MTTFIWISNFTANLKQIRASSQFRKWPGSRKHLGSLKEIAEAKILQVSYADNLLLSLAIEDGSTFRFMLEEAAKISPAKRTPLE